MRFQRNTLVITLQQILVLAFTPVAAFAVFLLPGLILPAQDAGATRSRPAVLIATLALAAAILGAHTGLFGSPTFPPRPVQHAYFWAAALAVLPALGVSIGATAPRLIFRAAIALALSWMVIGRKADVADWSTPTAIFTIIGVALGLAAVGEVWHLVSHRLERSHTRLDAIAPALAFAIILALAAPVVLMAGSLDVPSKLIGAVSASCVALAVAALLLRNSAGGHAAAAVGGTLLPVILLHAAFYSTLHWGYIVPLVIAPLGALITLAPPLVCARPLIRSAAIIAGAALIAAVPAGLAIIRYAHEY